MPQLTFARPYLHPMRLLAALACLAAAAGCGADDERPAPAQPRLADLTVTLDGDGSGPAKPRRAQVTCGGSADSRVCAGVAVLKAEAFAPTPKDRACTLQYGGPQTATVTGTLRGERVDARFSRENGCEISRWREAAALLGAAG
jgi:hypothetical protein